MRIDKQYDPPSVHPGMWARFLLLSGAVASLIVTSLWVVGALADANHVLHERSAVMSISLNPGDLADVAVAESPVNAEPVVPSYGHFVVEGLSATTSHRVATADFLEAVTVAIVGVLLIIVCVRTARGRSRWGSLSVFTATIGVVMFLGGAATQIIAKGASDAASSEIVRSDGHWIEPGFLSGLDITPALIGLVVVGLAVLMRLTSFHAMEADRVI